MEEVIFSMKIILTIFGCWFLLLLIDERLR